jgi:hypothetical protein
LGEMSRSDRGGSVALRNPQRRCREAAERVNPYNFYTIYIIVYYIQKQSSNGITINGLITRQI